jgi:15-cis-phytoene desaturase
VQQTQFWRKAGLPARTQGVLSVDISAWSVPGRFNQLEAYRCKPEEIADETWHQLKASLNRPGKPKILRDEMLLTGAVKGSYALDENIVDRFDRKKQAAYEKSWSVQFGAQEILEDVGKKGAAMEAALLTGNRMAVNLEPLLINRKGYLKLRPDAQTAISNLFLAGDYLNTSTNLACMEGANESARRAVNAILDADGSTETRCRIFTPSDSDVLSVLSRFMEAGARVAQIGDSPVAEAATNWLSDKRKKWKKLWG